MARIETSRLVLRPWTDADAPAALTVYGDVKVSSWLTPEMDRLVDLDHMRAMLHQWASEDADQQPTGHWAVEVRTGHRVVGGCSLRLMPGDDTDVQLTWALTPLAWGHGYSTEPRSALAHRAMHETDVYELFALLHADNTRGAATAKGVGMEWVREIGLDAFHVYRIRHADLASTDLTLEQVLDEATP